EEPFQKLLAGEDPGLTREDLDELRYRYDGKFAYDDREIGNLLAEVKALGHDDDTLVVVTSDHGEQFMEHGAIKHGTSLTREELHVPLVFRIPGGRLAGTRRPDRVSSVDIFPTVLGLLGIDPPSKPDGIDLFAEAPRADRLVFSETCHGWIRS